MSVREWMEAEDLQDIDLDEVVSRLQVGVLHVLKLHEWSTYGVRCRMRTSDRPCDMVRNLCKVRSLVAPGIQMTE